MEKANQIVYNIPDKDSVQKEGESKVYVHSRFPDYPNIVKELEDPNSTCWNLTKNSFKKYHNRDFLGYRKPKTFTIGEGEYLYFKYSDVEKMVKNLAFSLRRLNLIEEQKFDEEEGTWKFAGVYTRNCPDWAITELACQSDSVTTIALYATLGADSFKHIFNETKLKTLFISQDNIPKLLDFSKKFDITLLKNLIVLDMTLFSDKNANEIQELKKLGISIYFFSDLVKENVSDNFTLQEPSSTTPICIVYTSGTTSTPKGAKILHRGLYAQKEIFNCANIKISEDFQESLFSYLPNAHIFERLNFVAAIYNGMKINFISGPDAKLIFQETPLCKPTIMMFAPKVIINFCQLVNNIKNTFKEEDKIEFDKAFEIKRKQYQEKMEIINKDYDEKVFAKIRNIFGGQIKYGISGSAPLPKDISIDFKLLMSCPLVEGFGMTELAGASHLSFEEDLSNNSVGAVLKYMKFKLVDRLEIDYHSKTEFNGKPAPTGELCIFGPSTFAGYFRNAEKTKESIDEEGWVHTGDIGRIEPDNCGLKIIDRAKEIFKLVQGEYIAPTKLESMYIKSPLVAQICIYGHSEKTYILAIVVINKLAIEKVLKTKQLISAETPLENIKFEDYLNNEDLIQMYISEFENIAKECKFNSLEKPKKIILTTYEFTVTNELLTPSMKLIRRKIYEKFSKEISAIYV